MAATDHDRRQEAPLPRRPRMMEAAERSPTSEMELDYDATLADDIDRQDSAFAEVGWKCLEGFLGLPISPSARTGPPTCRNDWQRRIWPIAPPSVTIQTKT